MQMNGLKDCEYKSFIIVSPVFVFFFNFLVSTSFFVSFFRNQSISYLLKNTLTYFASEIWETGICRKQQVEC